MIAASTTPTNFAEKSDVLKKIKDDSPIEFLIHIPGSVQIKAPCFFLSLYDETVAKDIALKIMTSGLKKRFTVNMTLLLIKLKRIYNFFVMVFMLPYSPFFNSFV